MTPIIMTTFFFGELGR